MKIWHIAVIMLALITIQFQNNRINKLEGKEYNNFLGGFPQNNIAYDNLSKLVLYRTPLSSFENIDKNEPHYNGEAFIVWNPDTNICCIKVWGNNKWNELQCYKTMIPSKEIPLPVKFKMIEDIK